MRSHLLISSYSSVRHKDFPLSPSQLHSIKHPPINLSLSIIFYLQFFSVVLVSSSCLRNTVLLHSLSSPGVCHLTSHVRSWSYHSGIKNIPCIYLLYFATNYSACSKLNIHFFLCLFIHSLTRSHTHSFISESHLHRARFVCLFVELQFASVIE